MTGRKPTTAIDELLAPPPKRRVDYRGPRDWQAVAGEHGKPFTYRLPPELGQAVKNKAKAEGVKLSAFVAWALGHVLDELEAGRLELPL